MAISTADNAFSLDTTIWAVRAGSDDYTASIYTALDQDGDIFHSESITTGGTRTRTYALKTDTTQTSLPTLGTVVSGFVITSVTYDTSVGAPPTLTVIGRKTNSSSCKTFSPGAVFLLSRHRAQNIFASSASAATVTDLLKATFTWTCDLAYERENVLDSQTHSAAVTASFTTFGSLPTMSGWLAESPASYSYDEFERQLTHATFKKSL